MKPRRSFFSQSHSPTIDTKPRTVSPPELSDRMNHRSCIWALIVALAFCRVASAVNIDVFEMTMTTRVLVDGEQHSQYVFGPTNPLMTTRHAQLGLTEATSVFDLAWGPTGGRFDLLFDHVIEDGPGFSESTAFGGIGVTSDVDVWLDYQYTFSFNNLNGGIILTSVNQVAESTQTGATNIFRIVRQGGAGALDPTSGTFVTSRQVLLEANEVYGISYSNTLLGGEDSGALGTGNGSLHFTLTPVPEPATAMLLTLMSIVFTRRRRPSLRPLHAPSV